MERLERLELRHSDSRCRPDLTPEAGRVLGAALREVVHFQDQRFDIPMASLMACQQAPVGDDGEVTAIVDMAGAGVT